MERNKARILFVGLDSADPALLRAWGEDGLLPSMHGMRERSFRGRTIMPPGLGTGAMWTSLFSGVSPGKHGRYYGRQFRPDTYQAVAFKPDEIERASFWEVASETGKRVAVIDVPIAPLAKTLRGIQVKDWGTHDAVYPAVRTSPPELAAEVRRRFGSDPVGPCDRSGTKTEDYLALRDGLIERVRRKTELASHFLDLGGWDLFMVVFGDSHCVGHQCWHLHDPTHPRHDAEFLHRFGDPVRDVYVALDRAIGFLLERAGPETTVILFAGSGMGPDYTANPVLDEALRRFEGATPGRPGVMRVLKEVYNSVLPEALRLRLVPLTDRIDEASQAPHRRHRRFFAIPHNEISGAIRFNLIGRESSGRVRPGAECEMLYQQLRRDLMDLVEVGSGRAVVDEIVRTADVFEGRYLDVLPDLLVVWNREGPINGVKSAKIGEVWGFATGQRTGDHRPDGAFFAIGPGIASGELEDAVPVQNFAPTIAQRLGFELADVDGVPIAELGGR